MDSVSAEFLMSWEVKQRRIIIGYEAIWSIFGLDQKGTAVCWACLSCVLSIWNCDQSWLMYGQMYSKGPEMPLSTGKIWYGWSSHCQLYNIPHIEKLALPVLAGKLCLHRFKLRSNTANFSLCNIQFLNLDSVWPRLICCGYILLC